jgi:hypothetical protein
MIKTFRIIFVCWYIITTAGIRFQVLERKPCSFSPTTLYKRMEPSVNLKPILTTKTALLKAILKHFITSPMMQKKKNNKGDFRN